MEHNLSAVARVVADEQAAYTLEVAMLAARLAVVLLELEPHEVEQHIW